MLLRSWPVTSPLPPLKAPSASSSNANKARKTPLRVILNGLGKDAAQIISRINGFTYVQTQFDYYTGELEDRPRDPLLRGRARRRPLLRR